MTTQEFISNNFDIASQKDRHCSSVIADYKGNIYSYGRHYPLLFKVGELTFINATGYSNTTAKHINWARQAEPGAINVWLSGCNQYTWNNPENGAKVPAILRNNLYSDDSDAINAQLMTAVMADLEAELVDINKRISAKTRTNMQICLQSAWIAWTVSQASGHTSRG